KERTAGASTENGGGVAVSSRRLQRLLTSSSIVALVSAAAYAPAQAACVTITGNSGGYTNPSGSTVQCVTVTAATVAGNISNAGTITPGGPTGISVINSSTINGAVINSGTISVTGRPIEVITSTITSGITNSGT